MKNSSLLIIISLFIVSIPTQAVVLNNNRSKIEKDLIDQKLSLDSSAPIVLNAETKKLYIPDGTMYEVVYVCKHQEKQKSETCFFSRLGIK